MSTDAAGWIVQRCNAAVVAKPAFARQSSDFGASLDEGKLGAVGAARKPLKRRGLACKSRRMAAEDKKRRRSLPIT
jgi:hypothetical protein